MENGVVPDARDLADFFPVDKLISQFRDHIGKWGEANEHLPTLTELIELSPNHQLHEPDERADESREDPIDKSPDGKWVRYEGPKGGRGWQSVSDPDDVRYQDEPPLVYDARVKGEDTQEQREGTIARRNVDGLTMFADERVSGVLRDMADNWKPGAALSALSAYRQELNRRIDEIDNRSRGDSPPADRDWETL